MNTVELLTSARDLIAKTDLSHQLYARNTVGIGVSDLTSPDACRFCSVGAMAKVLGLKDPRITHDKNNLITKCCVALAAAAGVKNLFEPHIEVFRINDRSSKEEVLNWFEKAIKMESENVHS